MLRSVATLLLLLSLSLSAARAQGSLNFTVKISGSEIVGGQPVPITGNGTLQLFGSTLHYFVFVPVTVFPAETHFHGPRVDSETPIFSLAPYDPQPEGGILFRNSRSFDPKFLPDIRAGNWYIQLHSPDYVNGVLNGFILPVPEPSTTALLLFSAILIVFRMKSRT